MIWQDIATAPTDAAILVYCAGLYGELNGFDAEPLVAIASGGDSPHADPYRQALAGPWWSREGGEYYAEWVRPTHWMTLPAPPVADATPPGCTMTLADELEAHARGFREGVIQVIDKLCPSCHGLNTSCPKGCGRDKNGELDGSTLCTDTRAEVEREKAELEAYAEGRSEGLAEGRALERAEIAAWLHGCAGEAKTLSEKTVADIFKAVAGGIKRGEYSKESRS